MRKYVLITPARNEEKYIENTLRSILSQTQLPAQWIIVSDGSQDRTDAIVERYASKNDFIRLVKRTRTSGPCFGSKVEAFRQGYRAISVDYDFIGNLDADVTFEPDYYERLMGFFENDGSLGLAGGIISELIGKEFRRQKISPDSVAGAVQLFRGECFEDIGGYVPIPFGGIDSAAEIMARMKGWKVKTIEGLEVLHHRRVAGGKGVLRARFRSGIVHYLLGYHPAFQVFSSLYRLMDAPAFAGSLLTLSGYFWAGLRRYKRPVDRKFVDYLRSEQAARLRSLSARKTMRLNGGINRH